MAIHLVECAARVPLRPVEKLALLCFADSADRVTRIAFPGLPEITTWTGTGRSQVLAVISRLIELRLLERRRRGQRGQRAEFIVFPLGCCEAHGKTPSEPVNPDVGEALGADDFPETGSANQDPVGPPTGSDAQDPDDTDTGSASPDPDDPGTAGTEGLSTGSANQDPVGEKGSDPDPERVRFTARKGPILPKKGSCTADPSPKASPSTNSEQATPIGHQQDHLRRATARDPTNPNPSGVDQQRTERTA